MTATIHCSSKSSVDSKCSLFKGAVYDSTLDKARTDSIPLSKIRSDENSSFIPNERDIYIEKINMSIINASLSWLKILGFLNEVNRFEAWERLKTATQITGINLYYYLRMHKSLSGSMRRQITYRVKIIAKFGSLACDTWQNLKLNDVSSLSKLNELRAKNIIVFTEEQIDLFFRNFGISAKEKGRDLLSINSTACAHFFFRIKKVNEFYQLNIHDKYFFLNLARLFNQDYINDNYKDFHPWTLKEPVGGLLEQQFLAKRLDLMRGINVKDLVLFTKLDACAIYLYEWLHLTLEKSEDMGLHIPQIVIEKRLEEQRLKPTFIANMEESDELMDLEIDDLIKLFKIAKIFYASISTDYFSFIKKSYFPEFWIKEFLLSLISDKS